MAESERAKNKNRSLISNKRWTANLSDGSLQQAVHSLSWMIADHSSRRISSLHWSTPQFLRTIRSTMWIPHCGFHNAVLLLPRRLAHCESDWQLGPAWLQADHEYRTSASVYCILQYLQVSLQSQSQSQPVVRMLSGPGGCDRAQCQAKGDPPGK